MDTTWDPNTDENFVPCNGIINRYQQVCIRSFMSFLLVQGRMERMDIPFDFARACNGFAGNYFPLQSGQVLVLLKRGLAFLKRKRRCRPCLLETAKQFRSILRCFMWTRRIRAGIARPENQRLAGSEPKRPTTTTTR